MKIAQTGQVGRKSLYCAAKSKNHKPQSTNVYGDKGESEQPGKKKNKPNKQTKNKQQQQTTFTQRFPFLKRQKGHRG